MMNDVQMAAKMFRKIMQTICIIWITRERRRKSEKRKQYNTLLMRKQKDNLIKLQKLSIHGILL